MRGSPLRTAVQRVLPLFAAASLSSVALADGLRVDAQQSISGMEVALSSSDLREAETQANRVIVKVGESAKHRTVAVIGSGRSADGKRVIVGPGELQLVDVQWAEGNRDYALRSLEAITGAFQASRALPYNRTVASKAYWMLARAYSTQGTPRCAQMARALVRADLLGFFVDAPKHEGARDSMYQAATLCLTPAEAKNIESEEIQSISDGGLAYLLSNSASDSRSHDASGLQSASVSEGRKAPLTVGEGPSEALHDSDQVAARAGQVTGSIVRSLQDGWKRYLAYGLLFLAAFKLWGAIRTAFGDVGAVDLTSSRNRKVRESHAKFERC